MKYRDMKKIPFKPSALGFGCMRLPVRNNDQADIDEDKAIEMIRYAIDHGVNYIDTAYAYHQGNSEILVAKALKDGYREKVKIATKLPSWLINTADDMDRYFEEQRKKLGTNHIDFYMLHTLNRKYWENYKKIKAIDWLENLKDKGDISYYGFSFHDDFDCFKDIIDYYDGWMFAQIQYNYMDVNKQAGIRGLKYAHEKNVAVIVMEPLHGGHLTKTPPPSIEKMWNDAPPRSLSERALLWLWNQPEVSLVLSGMTTLDQVKDNIRIADQSEIGMLKEEELNIIDEVRKEYEKLCPIPCGRCGYCVPCPQGVAIPEIFNLYNEMTMYNDPQYGKMLYGFFFPSHIRADQCVECGACESHCPQSVEIIQWLKKCHTELV